MDLIGAEMKIYNHILVHKKQTYYKRTLLQFGNSVNLIGSLVLDSPEKPISQTEIDLNNTLVIPEFFRSNEIFRSGFETGQWYEINMTPTFEHIEKIFNGHYAGESFELNGVIQVFYALQTIPQTSNRLFSLIMQANGHLLIENLFSRFYRKPVYFGVGRAYQDEPCSEREADTILSVSRDLQRSVVDNFFRSNKEEYANLYDLELSKNKFYHPNDLDALFNKNQIEDYQKRVLKPFAQMIQEGLKH